MGLVVMIVVILAAMMVPMLGGRRIVGTAVALIIPAAPQVGDCLLRAQGDPASRVDDDPGPKVVSCASRHNGEVITQTATVVGVPASRRGGGHVPDLAACASTAYRYLGVHPLDGSLERSAVLGPWWPAFAGDFEALSPGALQLRTGQSWAACVMTSQHGLIIGSAARLFASGAPRSSPIALCTPAGDVALYRSVSCDQPHPTEILGWRVADENINSPTAFAQSCVDLARRIMGTADPTAQGALRVAVVAIHSIEGPAREGWGPGHSGPYRAACTISTAGSRMLTSSLTGLAAAPLPWA